LSSSTDSCRPSGGCRLHSSSSASIASRTTRSISCRFRRIWHSSSARPRSVSYLDQELEARIWEKKSHWIASARARLVSHSMCTSPSVGAKATKPSSHAMMAPSRLSSSLSRERSCSCNSTGSACKGDEALCQSISKSRHHDKEASPGKRRHRVKTYLAGGEARLEEASILAQRDGN
jgi:hypothetical protein